MRRTQGYGLANSVSLAMARVDHLEAMLTRVTDGRVLVYGSTGSGAESGDGNGGGPPIIPETSVHVLYGSKHTKSLRVTAGAGLNASYEEGSVRVDETYTLVAAGSIALTDSATNYVFVNNLGVVAKNTTGFPANCVPLAEVVTAGGVVTSVADRRSYLTGHHGPTFLGDVKIGVDGSAPVLIMAAQDAVDEGGQIDFHSAGAWATTWHLDAYRNTLRAYADAVAQFAIWPLGLGASFGGPLRLGACTQPHAYIGFEYVGTIDGHASGNPAHGMNWASATLYPANGQSATALAGGGRIQVDAGETVPDTYSCYLAAQIKVGTGTITNAWGLIVEEPTIGVTNYAAQIVGWTRIVGANGKLNVGAWARIGDSWLAPVNTTAGDLTALRAVIGANTAIEATAALDVEGGALVFGNLLVTNDPASRTINPLRGLSIFHIPTITAGSFYELQSLVDANPSGASSATYVGQRVFAESRPGNVQNFTGYLVGLDALVQHSGSGTMANLWAGQLSNFISLGAGNVGTCYGLYVHPSSFVGGSVAQVTGEVQGIHIDGPALGAGPGVVANYYGIYLVNCIVATTLNVGIRIEGMNTAALWLSSDTASRNVIAWGSGRDTNLYRHADGNVLATDDALRVARYARVGAVTAPTNVTAGDLNAARLFVGADAAITAGFIADIAGALRVGTTLKIIQHTRLASVAADPAYVDGEALLYFYSDGAGADELRVRGKIGAVETQVTLANLSP